MGCLSHLLGSVAAKGARNETVCRLLGETNGVTAMLRALSARSLFSGRTSRVAGHPAVPHGITDFREPRSNSPLLCRTQG